MESKKVCIKLPTSLVTDIDAVAEVEYRTRTNLIQEALRIYIANFESDREYQARCKRNLLSFKGKQQ